MSNPMDYIEKQELIQKLIDNGYSSLVEAMLMNETKCYTRRNRTNKSGTCRVLGWKPKQLDDALRECRKILGEDVL